MKNFVNYTAVGVVYKLDQQGKKAGILRRVYCNGVPRLDRNFMGSIHRQNPDLLPCHAISVKYWRP